MCAARRSAPWPQLVALSLIGIAVASCSANSGRFNEGFGSSPSYSSSSRSDVTGSIPQTAPPASHVDSWPLPSLASADNGASGGGRGMGSYQPSGDVTGSVAPPPPQPAWTWDGGTAVTVRPGQTVEGIAREHGVPVATLREANHIASGASVYPGEHLVIPRYRPATAAEMPPPARTASSRAGGHSALRSAARWLGRAFRFACRGARRNAQQHCAALRQAGYGHCPRQ